MVPAHPADRIRDEGKDDILNHTIMKNITATLTLTSLLAGVLLTIWGLAHLQWPQALPWSNMDAFSRYVGFLFVTTTLVFVGSWWSRQSALLVGAVIAVGFAILSSTLWPLLVTLWFAIASLLLGKFILSGLRLKIESNRWLMSFLVGAGAYGTVVGLIAHFPVSYPGVYGVALALPVILGWRVAVAEIKIFLGYINTNQLADFYVKRLDVAIAVVALIYFVVALMPEVGFDSLAMHLFIPAHLALRHQWGFDAGTYVWAVMPMLGDWIFSIGYMLAGETAARFINVGFIFILSWLIRELVFWAGGSGIGARWAVLIFLSTPLSFTEGSSLFIESVWASFVVAGTLVLLNACSNATKPKFDLPVSGLLFGCAIAAKSVTLTILPVLLLLLIWRWKTWYRTTSLHFLLIGICLFLLMGLTPYLTAWHLTGNPVFPFFNHIFHSSYYPIIKDAFSAAVFNQGMKWDVLYQVTFQSWKYLESVAGASGFQWLLLFLPASILVITKGRWRGIALLVIGVTWVVFVFQSTSYLRYVFPACIILIATIGVAMDVVSSRSGVLKNLGYIVATVVVGLNILFLNAGGFYGDFVFKSMIDISSRNRYLEGRLPMRNAVELVNRLNTGRAPVAVFANPQMAGLAGDALYPSWYDSAFQQEISSIHTEQDLANMLLRRGVHFIILDSNWNGVNCCGNGVEKQALVEKLSEKIAEYGSLSVRKVKLGYLFNAELLSNPDFKSISGWSLAPGAKYDADAHIIQASVSSPAVQVVAISEGRLYLNSVIARCIKEPTVGRIQINWLDIKGQFISKNIKTFECSQTFTEYTMEIIAPSSATNAVVYIAGQSANPLEFKRNSLRQ